MSSLDEQAATVDVDECTALLRRILRGAWIIRIEYFRTSWEVSFCLPEAHELIIAGVVDEHSGVLLEASEIRARLKPNVSGDRGDEGRDWDDDVEAAQSLFRSARYCVSDVTIIDASTIHLCFDGGTEFFVPGVVNLVDEVWSVAPGNVPGSKRPFGGRFYAQSYSGVLSGSLQLLS